MWAPPPLLHSHAHLACAPQLDSLHLETVANMDRRLMGSSPKSLSVWVSMPSPLLSPNSLTGWGRCVHTGDSCDHWPVTPVVSFGSSFHNGADGICCAFGAAVHAQLGPGFVGSDCDAWPTSTKAQALPHDVWHHLAVTYAGGRAPVRVWLNGTVVATRSAGLGPLQTRGPSGVGLARRLTIGADSWWYVVHSFFLMGQREGCRPLCSCLHPSFAWPLRNNNNTPGMQQQ